jgi:hypothetical protein
VVKTAAKTSQPQGKSSQNRKKAIRRLARLYWKNLSCNSAYQRRSPALGSGGMRPDES